jgi:hypothetical protein
MENRQKLFRAMKKFIFSLAVLFIASAAMACPVCERNQPKMLKGIVHGAGPQSNWDYVGVVIISIVTLITLFYTIKYLARPGEKNKDHIKYHILN